MNKIGILAEKTLHSYIKSVYTENGGECEVKIGTFFADVADKNRITEIQTRDFYRLENKISFFINNGYSVTVVLPVPRIKWLVWMNPDTGEVSSKRKSPRIGTPLDILPEIYGLRKLLPNASLSFDVFLTDIEQYKSLDGWSRDKKKGASSIEKYPLINHEIVSLATVSDYISILPPNLPETFTSSDFAKAVKRNRDFAQRALNVLNTFGAVQKVGKNGNAFLYEVKVT